MSEETPQERQESEIEVLKAIFGDDLVDNRPQIAWKVWRPLDMLLTLTPLHSSTAGVVHCALTLHIVCCHQYPHKPPTLKIHKLRGISNDNGYKLLEELNLLAARLCGEVMIYELAQHVQNFLHQHNKPSKSFYEEMLERRDEQEKLKQLDLLDKETKERQQLHEEIQRRRDMLRAGDAARPPRGAAAPAAAPPADDGDVRPAQPELVFYAEQNVLSLSTKKKAREKAPDVPCACPKGIQILRVSQRNSRKVHIGKCIGHSSTGATTSLAIDADTGEHLIVKKWSLDPPSDIQARTKQFTSIEQDLTAASRLKAPSLVPYTAMETHHESADVQCGKKRTGSTCVYLLRAYVLGISLKRFRTKIRELGEGSEMLRLVRHVACGVFGALSELHRVGVLHRDVRAENVFLDDSGEVRLVDAGLDLRLQEIVDGTSHCSSHSKSHDIYCTAQMLLSLVSDPLLTGQQEIPSHLPSSMKDFFSRCLTEEEHSQWSAERLLGHEFLGDAPARETSGRDPDDGYSGSEEDDRGLARTLVQSSLPASGHSRLNAEFEILKWLGRGAFGDVLKVKNKLDGGFYAIKRIELNPESVQLNKKITREVKLLSRLNHENVVRYYNAWIETMETPVFTESREKDCSSDSKIANNVPKIQVDKGENSTEQAMAKLGVRLEWSMSDLQPQRQRSSESITDSSESDDEEDDEWFKFRPTNAEDSDSSSVEFEDDTGNKSQTLPSETSTEISRPPTANIHQVLYIQMEFCEKNTLRHAIDNGLYLEKVRGWRLFREIVEGLAHVHQRGMIHRDLKPVNIFLDSNDHVKIGDFGLATKAFTGLPAAVEDKSKASEDFNGSMTGQVGTALYVAPELLQAGNKVMYNQKVDIYSLGVILFEMFHPLDTGMERMKILSDLRSKDIVMPQSFLVEENNKQIHLIRWLMCADAGARPSCAELLASEHVPRPLPAPALSALLSHTLSDRRSRAYQRLVAACLEQRFTPAEDLTYDSGLRIRTDPAVVAAREIAVSVFRRAGAAEYSPPLLTPRAGGGAWDACAGAARLLTRAGAPVHLPHDLRAPLARHVAYSGARHVRRYTVARVYRERAAGFHPRELLECAFDIVAPAHANLWADAELLAVASAAVTEMGLRVSVQLNHTAVLTAVLAACGIPADRHAGLYPVLVDVRSGRISNLQLQTHLTSLCLSARGTALLLRLMEAEVAAGAGAARALLAPLAGRGGGAHAHAERAVRELELVARQARALGAECAMSIVPCLAYNATQHDGVFWQALVVRAEQKPPPGKHRSGELVAAGGRYDALLEQYRRVARSEPEGGARTGAVGLSMSLERIAAVARNEAQLAGAGVLPLTKEQRQVVVCVWGAGAGGDAAAARRAALVRSLRARRLPCAALECRGASDARDLTGAALLLEVPDDDCASVRVTHALRDRLTEHRMPMEEAVDYVEQYLKDDTGTSPEATAPSRSMSWCETEKASNPQVTVMIITRERLASAARRRYEIQATSAATSALAALGASVRVCVLGVSCSAEALRRLAAELDAPLTEPALTNVFRAVQDVFPSQQKILAETLDVVRTLARNTSEDAPVLALYCIPKGPFKLIS